MKKVLSLVLCVTVLLLCGCTRYKSSFLNSTNSTIKDNVIIIRNAAALNECVAVLGYDTASAGVSEKFSVYNDEFFEKHTLLILHLVKESTSTNVSVADVNIKDGVVDIELNFKMPDAPADGGKTWDFFIEITKTDIKSVSWTK